MPRRSYDDFGRYYDPDSGRMAGGYARESAKPRDRRNSEDYDPVQEFHPDELKISKAHRKAANLRSFGDLAPSIDQPASRTLGSKVLYSNPSESGGNLLREEWDRPIYDPPTQDGYMNYKQATANTGYHHRGYEKRKAGMEAEEAVFYGWHHESLIEPAAQWRDAALNSARLREGHLGENRFRANRDRWSLRGHQEQINALYNSYKKGQEAYNMHLINSYPTGRRAIYDIRVCFCLLPALDILHNSCPSASMPIARALVLSI